MEHQLTPTTKFIDTTHKYTDVLTDGYVGPGGAHHHYIVLTKRIPTAVLAQINFQDGPILEAGVNGVMDENLLAIVIDRLRGFQAGKYACKENQDALDYIELGLEHLRSRTGRREKEGKEGTHKV